MLTLNINKLRTEVEEREKKKLKIFDNVLEMCYKKILNTNKQYDNYSCTFIVPNVVFGLPLYNVGDCVKFIMDKLIDKGFEIYFALPTTIHISWKPESTNYVPQNNQIEYYNTLNPQNQLIIKYNGSNGSNGSNSTSKNIKTHINNNTQKNNNHKNSNSNNNIQYRPVDEYKEHSKSIYDLNDLYIFENKVENLF